MNKYKYLLKNISLLTVSNFASKLLSFFLVPLYTNVLTTQDYGKYDLFNTTISLLIPVLTLNIYDAVMRFTIEKGSSTNLKAESFTYGLKLTGVGALLVSAFVYFNSLFNLIPLLNTFGIFFVAMFISNALSQLFANFARGLDRIKEVAVAGVTSTIAGLTFNFWFLLELKLGLIGYFLAGILSSIFPCIYYFFKIPLYRYITIKKITSNYKKDLLLYSIPLMLNSIGWWVNNLSDRYIVTGICGVAANGIYSVGYKIPSILNIFVTIFNQAWTLSAVKEYDPLDKTGFFSKLYELYNGFLVLGTSVIICADQVLARLLYAKEFYIAWKYVPFLTIAFMFGAIAGYFGGVFTASKDTKSIGNSTIVGAVVNTALNFILVYLIGPIGAAIATLTSYFFVWVYRIIVVRKYIKLRINTVRDVASYILLLLQTTALILIKYNGIKYCLLILMLCIIILLYKNEFGIIHNKVMQKFKDR